MNNETHDDEFVQAFLAGSLPPTQFHHQDHLRLAWYLTRQFDLATATQIITSGIRRFATQHGQAAKYHETMTQFWVRVVHLHVQMRPDCTEFTQFLALFPQLLDKSLPNRHWRTETMASLAARAEWVEPDVLALPL